MSLYGRGLSRAYQRESGKKKEEEEKSPEKNHFAMTGTWTHGLCLQSQACYPLGHGALPNGGLKSHLNFLNFDVESGSYEESESTLLFIVKINKLILINKSIWTAK